MYCNVKQNTTDHFKKKGFVNENMVLTNAMFYYENNKLSDLARNKYGVTNQKKLFNVVRLSNDNFKAVPNEEFFSELQQKHNEYQDRSSSEGVTSGNTYSDVIRNKYFSDGATQKSTVILEKIAQSSHPFASLAKHLLSYTSINNVDVILEPVENFKVGEIRNSPGYFSSSDNHIKIAEFAKYKNANRVETLLMHEILHALSKQALRQNSSANKKFNDLYEKSMAVLGKYNPETREGLYGNYTIDEFFVGIFTDSQFINALSNIPSEKSGFNNLFEEIMDFLLNLLGIKKGTTLHTEAYAVATNILSEYREYTDYLSEQSDMFDNQDNFYQLNDKKVLGESLPELDNYLLNFMKQFGVKSKEFDDLKARLGVDALGATDVLNKLIWYTKNRNEETIPEEVGHMAVMLMGEEHPDIKELLKEITNWSEYSDIKKEYFPIYNNEKQVKIEAVGKLIAKALVRNYKANGLNQSLLQKALASIKAFIEKLLNTSSIAEALQYNDKVADHIAINLLMGNKDYIAKIQNIGSKLDYKKALQNNPFAQFIINTFTKFNFKLTGSLAIAGQGEVIYRPSKEPIHDIDFNVDSFEDYNKIEKALQDLNAVPYHFGWDNAQKDYKTFAFLIPKEGFTIQVISRDFEKGNGWVTDYKVLNKNGVEVEKNSQNHVAVDFFVYKNGIAKSKDSIFKSAVDIYNGKMTLSRLGNEERMFQREKDRQDYILHTPKTIQESLPQFTYLQKGETESSKASPAVISAIKTFLKNIGVSVETLKDISVNGVKQDANGVALIMQKLIQLAEGKEDVAITEEAMHFAVEIIQQKDPELFKQLLKEINNYQIYKQVLADYGNNPLYQTKEGKPDILKLKKEAIAKVLAEQIIGRVDGFTEKPELLAKVQSWWQKILNAIRALFQQSAFNVATTKILMGEMSAEDVDFADTQFLQKTPQEQTFDKLKEIDQQLTKKDDKYWINGKEIANRVTNLIKSWYERRFRSKELLQSDYEKAVNDLKAEKGTDGHADFEQLHKVFIDDNGYVRAVPLDDSQYQSRLNPDDRTMYEILKKNFKERIDLLNADGKTRFMSEVQVYDEKRNLAGTIDFLAIESTGRVNILDWKFMDLYTEKWKDVPWYKVAAWRQQMDQYKIILSTVYGVKQFGQTRMIPIKATYIPGNAKLNLLPKLSEIRIGDVDIKNIEDKYLIPVGLEEETTENEELDGLLKKLNAEYKRLSEAKVLPSEKREKATQLNELFDAIRQLQMRNNLKPLLEQAKLFNNQVQKTIDKYGSDWENADPLTQSDDKVNDYAKEIENILDILHTYTTLDTDLDLIFGESGDEELMKDLRKTASNARIMERKVKSIQEKFVNGVVAKREGMTNISVPEKIVRGFSKWFSTTSTIQIKAIQTIFKKANRIFAYAAQDILVENKKLETIKEEYDKWAKSKGLTLKSYFNIIKKGGSNRLVDQYDPAFYSELTKKIGEKDIAWIKDNIDVAAYEAFLTEQIKKEYERVEERYGGPTEEEQKKVEKEKEEIRKLYSIANYDSAGWYQYDLVKKFPKDKHFSDDWIELTKPENAPAYNFYKYIKERNEYYQEIGYINKAEARYFLPFIRKGLLEKMVFGGKISLGEQFLRSISIDDSDTGYGQTDPLTGNPINRIPVYFTKEIEGELSGDLFKNMALYNEMAIRFKNLSDIEYQVRALVNIERNKQAIKTSVFGKTKWEDGKIAYSNSNAENAELVEKMMKAIVYQQKYIESDTFDQLLGTFGDFGKRVNEKLGIKLLPENLEGRQVSANKLITNMNNMFQLEVLGFNLLSSISNLFGGSAQSIINAGVYFTKTDFIGTEAWVFENKMKGMFTKEGDVQKMMAALEYFLPLTENYNREFLKKLSIGKLTQENVQDILMTFMRNSDLLVQSANFFSYLKNTILIDGRVVNAREYLRKTDEYKDMFAGTPEQRSARKEKFEQDVKKLIESNGLMLSAKIENGALVIPGVDKKSDDIIEIRRKVQQLNKDALGNLTEDDLRAINLNVYGKSFMMFKGWIPRLMDIRFGNLKYNAGSDAYEWGRMRMITRMVSEDLMGSLKNLGNIFAGSDKGIEFMRKLYEKKKADYEQDTGKPLEMTEAEFMDLATRNVKAQLVDAIFLLTLFMTFMALKAFEPDEDEDKTVRNQYKFLLRAADKLRDELLYFYNPTSILSLASSGIFPSMGMVKDFMKLLKSFGMDMFGFAIGNEEMMKDANLIKYLMKTFPVTNQMQQYLPMFYPELAKELGIKMQSQSRPLGL
jgi:hypothetical protein